MSILFTPLTIRNTTLKNRIVVSPMCMYSSEDGFANDWHLVHLGSRASGGAALVIQEATAISPEGRISPQDLGIWKDEHIAKLKQITSFIHSQNALAGIQLAHSGRKGSCRRLSEGGAQIPSDHPEGWQTVGPSAIPFNEGMEAPAELTLDAIELLKDQYRQATRRAVEVGYDIVEIHAAHGYLLHEFFSPWSNHRTDAYGGNFDNRVRLLIEITRIVKEEWGDEKPLFVRISATDWVEGGWTIEDSIKLASMLKALGVDLIDTSSGGNVATAKIPVAPDYQVEFADAIKKHTGMLTGAVGLITSAPQAESILQSGQADLILLARQMLRDPYFALHAASELKAEIQWPVQYERGKV